MSPRTQWRFEVLAWQHWRQFLKLVERHRVFCLELRVMPTWADDAATTFQLALLHLDLALLIAGRAGVKLDTRVPL